MAEIETPAGVADDLREALRFVLGDAGVVWDPALLAARSGDWSEATKTPPALVLLPRTPQQVADVLALCARHRQSIVVQGGLTGLAGGATPAPAEVALSLARLDQIEDVDAVGGTATVQAGVVLEELQARVESQDWYFPLDLGARGSCQLGGNAATNAGGNRVIRYGTMRELVQGIEVALPDGRLLTMMNRVTKNTTGIDLKHLFIGAEGTLGVITRLVLKLSPRPTASSTALCALPSFEAALGLLKLWDLSPREHPLFTKKLSCGIFRLKTVRKNKDRRRGPPLARLLCWSRPRLLRQAQPIAHGPATDFRLRSDPALSPR